MTEIVFLVEEVPEGGYVARTLGESIFTQAETLEQIPDQARDAVRCHFGDSPDAPKMIRLQLVKANQALLDVRDAEREFEVGQCRPMSAEELMKEIIP